MSEFRKQVELCETVFDITTVAVDMIHAGTIEVNDSRELFQTIYRLAEVFEDSDYDPDFYMDEIEAYARKQLMLEYGDLSSLHGRIWWDIEEEKFIGEAQLYDEYLVNRHDGLTFEEYIRGCMTEENGTLVPVREG